MQTKDPIRKLEPPKMSAQELEMARVAQRCIMEALDRSKAVSITLMSDGDEQPSVAVPPAALKLIGQLLGALSEGRPVVLMPGKQELTTVEAANYLNVSRPFVIKEIEAGRLPHRMVGRHRRIAFEDLVTYERKMREKQRAALERMAENERELGLDY
jgi:excisionase family DNA binding protein